MKKLAYLLSAVMVLSGCKSIGPTALKQTHPSFNRAIAQTLDEQLLLNLVRMKYRDTTFFLEISSITDSRNLTFKGGMDDTTFFVNNPGKTSEWNPVVAVTTSQSPTVSYSPLSGQNFVKRMFTPVSIPVVLGLTQSGWNVARVFAIFVERINDLENAPTASGPAPSIVPNYKDFWKFSSMLARLMKDDSVTLGVSNEAPSHLVMEVFPTEENAQMLREFKSLLKLSQTANRFTFEENFLSPDESALRIRLRSIQGAMFYLSNGVEVPQRDIDNGLVTTTRYSNGEAFDWQEMLGGLFTVHHSKERPSNAYAAVNYRGTWFYIADDDLSSKTTFMLLASVFNLQAGETKSITPTLTIPVGR